MKKYFEYISCGLVILLITIALAVNLIPRFGWRIDSVLSGSMEPQLKVGSIVVTQPLKSENIRVGDAITFYSPLHKEMVTHRVVSIVNDYIYYFRTKGDANEEPDPYIVPSTNVAGKVCLHIPYLGYAIQAIKTPLGLLFTLLVPGVVIIAMEIFSIRRVLSTKKQVQTARIDR
jgi:signal peptidase I